MLPLSLSYARACCGSQAFLALCFPTPSHRALPLSPSTIVSPPPSCFASYLLYQSNCRLLRSHRPAYVTHLIDLSYASSFVSLLSSQHSTPPPEARLCREPSSLNTPLRDLHEPCTIPVSHEDTPYTVEMAPQVNGDLPNATHSSAFIQVGSDPSIRSVRLD